MSEFPAGPELLRMRRKLQMPGDSDEGAQLQFSSELKGENSEITVSCSMSAIKFTTQAEEKAEEQCQCKNIMEYQSNANEEITRRMEELENRVGQR
ncbi:hypothetical protein GDO81_011245 [Engystomops pustulosus]|uniref:Uncharacterized protein n=1 Tax=Engystomops pustulosus TaxID=76066 RepID=A0AAV7BD26_ENGPU|nr:hypothetical protein GDO81_011245 [Engystomops pustulosus]